MKDNWEGPGDPIYVRPPSYEGYRCQPMITVKDITLLSDAAARWPEPNPTDDIDWT